MRLLGVSLMCFVVLLSSMAVMIYYGQQQPELPAVRDIHLCEDRFCVLTLIPNKTTSEAALAFISSDPQFELSADSNRTAYRRAVPSYRLDLYLHDSVLTELDLLFSRANVLTANAFIAKFGRPCAVLPHYMADSIVLIYPGMVAFFADDSPPNLNRFRPSAAAQQINVFDNQIDDCSRMKFDGSITRWRGFRSY